MNDRDLCRLTLIFLWGSWPRHRHRIFYYPSHRVHRFPDRTVNSVVPQFISPAQEHRGKREGRMSPDRADANPCLPPQAVPFSWETAVLKLI
jgi:hypothetical protein